MTVFWLVASLLCVLAVGVLIVPLWRRHGLQGRWSGTGVVTALAIVPIAVGLYLHLTNYDPSVAERAHESNRLVNALAERLQGTPDDLNGWRLLANSYMALGRYDEGWAAYEHIWTRTPVPDAELTVSYAEAQILTDRGNLTGEAGRLIESALTADPANAKALWYGGLVAVERGQRDVARTRWTSLLAMNLPQDIDAMVRGRLAELGGGATSPIVAAAASPAGGVPPPAASGPTIKLNVTLGPGRSLADLGPNAQLFIFARAPEGGPPLAVLRQPAAAVPGEFTLSDANSMIQGRSIGNYAEVTLVARLSRSGQPTAQPGDWEAEAVAKPTDADPIALVIDRVVQ